MPKLSDSDPEKWKYDLHTQIKHQILMNYLDPWTTILGQGAESLAYVDGFAGRGRYATREPGSPLLVVSTILRAMDARHIKASHISFHFVEKDPTNFSNLQQELAAYPAAQDPRVEIALYQRSFSAASGEIITRIRRRAEPSFFFVDPFGYSDPSMAVLQNVLAIPKAEVMVNLMYDFATRAVGIADETLGRTLDGLFGTPDWRNLVSLAGEERERAFLELYRSQIKAGHDRYVLPFRMGDDTRDRTLYYLLHATKHIKGAQVMKSATVASGTPGSLGYDGMGRHRLTPLFDIDAVHLPAKLLQWFAGQTLTFDDVVARHFDETGTCLEKDYRACLKGLEQAGSITVQRVSPRGPKGLGGKDRISFPPAGASVQATLFGL